MAIQLSVDSFVQLLFILIPCLYTHHILLNRKLVISHHILVCHLVGRWEYEYVMYTPDRRLLYIRC